MYKFKFNILKEDIDNHIRKSLTEEENEMLKNVKFVPFSVYCNEDMEIEVTAVGVFEPEIETSETENIEDNDNTENNVEDQE